MAVPTTIAECDKEIADYMVAMKLVSHFGRIAVWEQIDRILEIRYRLQSRRS